MVRRQLRGGDHLLVLLVAAPIKGLVLARNVDPKTALSTYRAVAMRVSQISDSYESPQNDLDAESWVREKRIEAYLVPSITNRSM